MKYGMKTVLGPIRGRINILVFTELSWSAEWERRINSYSRKKRCVSGYCSGAGSLYEKKSRFYKNTTKSRKVLDGPRTLYHGSNTTFNNTYRLSFGS